MAATQILIMITMIVYLGGMIGIGIAYSRRNRTVDDFYLGGRKLGPLVTAMSAEASDMSSWLLMGLPGVALLAGLPEAVWTALGLAVGTYINWLVVAKRLRIYSHKIGALTIPEFFSKRYHDEKNVLNLIAAVVIVVFFIPYTASGFNACGTLFSTLFGVNYFTAMLLSAIVLIIYVTLGGFLAASTSDFIQSIIMTIALVVIVGFGVSTAGGWGAVAANAQSLPGYLNLFQGYDVSSGGPASYGPLVVASTLAWGLGYFGMPHILLRFMAIEDHKKLTLSRRVATVWVVISMGVAILIGIVGNAMIANGSLAGIEAANSQRIIIYIADLLSKNGVLAAVVAGLILSGILAATMSTADSQLLAAASSISQDIAHDIFQLKLSQKKQMLLARITIVIIAIIAVIWAREEGSVFYIVSFAWGGFGAAFGPVMLLALFWKKSNKWGALAGMLTGGIMVFVWKYLVRPLGGVLDIYELLPAFIIALIVNVIVSLATGGAEKEVVSEYESIRS
ncbi:MAG: sodium/proline symporter [Lachnospiraceae bacterium]|nr:sodium/proline symporter [Lachnospiraceae bacterium]MBQ6546297.1 sodium/proline symporter [Lachnospiraceae bacterium]